MKFKSLLLVLLATFGVSACANYVQSIQPVQDQVADNLLDDPSQFDFLITGIQRQFSVAFGDGALYADGLSDALIFDARVPNATFPTFDLINQGTPQLDNNSVSGLLTDMGNYRLLADTLAVRVGRTRIDTANATQVAQRNRALYNSYLHSGIARHLYATWIGLEARRGGATIASGPFIPSTALHDSAIGYLTRSLPFGTEAQRRVANSIIARIHLFEGRFPQARTAAMSGMRAGDVPLNVLYNAQTISNRWWTQGGRGRPQFVPDPRFAAYVRADAKEGRIFAGGIAGVNITTPATDAELSAALMTGRMNLIGPLVRLGLTFHVQANFPNQDSPQRFITWQENRLMLAELAARNGNDMEALTEVNAVRTSYGLDARTTTNLDSIYIERDKTLFGTGTRLADQRRFNRWHLPATTWWYLPITLPERTTNPNLRTP